MSKKITVQSLDVPDYAGWMTKQGGAVKNWKKRYFVLKGNNVYYFKHTTDANVTGTITLDSSCFVRRETKGKKNLFAVGTPSRIFFMFPETEKERDEWISKIKNKIDVLNNSRGTHKTLNEDKIRESTSQMELNMDPRKQLEAARNEILFLDSERSKVSDFWKIWYESLPSKALLDTGKIVFEIAISGDMEKLSWKAHGPQHIYIQKMVDFFYNVGAPEDEIDHLNNIGSRTNPPSIGSWIDMSGKGGMDAGWFFPVSIPLSQAVEAADMGTSIDQLLSWSKENNMNSCVWIGRDMGAAPPRQTEFKVNIDGNFETILSISLSAFRDFGFPEIPNEAIDIIRSLNPQKVVLSIVTIKDDFVRLGILFPSPQKLMVESLCNLSGGNSEQLFKFEKAIKSKVSFVEFQCLKQNYGYGVYKEGFDVMFHYVIGEEHPEK
eukprot:TRINITY_DN2460_c0_g1_i2.p1 TRINITY_DN2460_c0_g1~~TRINITY_DN2460_c0_g1_i2.p1  ORF type:complete len:455 (+),score=110.84 TRINITY_DN2460_c0_g1_i2:58-1365(+)